MRSAPLLLLLALASVSSPAIAESESQLWTSAEVRYRPVKKVRVYLTQHLRFDQDMSHLDAVIPELTVSWSVLDWLRLGTGYRYGLEKTKSDVFRAEHRFHLQGSFEGELGPVGLSYRLRFQGGIEMDDPVERTQKIRHKIAAELDTDTDFTPELSAELFQELIDQSPIQQEKADLTAGVEYQASKSHLINLFYRLRTPLADENDPFEHIIGLGYQFRLRTKK